METFLECETICREPPPEHVVVESLAEIDPRKVAEVVRRSLDKRSLQYTAIRSDIGSPINMYRINRPTYNMRNMQYVHGPVYHHNQARDRHDVYCYHMLASFRSASATNWPHTSIDFYEYNFCQKYDSVTNKATDNEIYEDVQICTHCYFIFRTLQ